MSGLSGCSSTRLPSPSYPVAQTPMEDEPDHLLGQIGLGWKPWLEELISALGRELGHLMQRTDLLEKPLMFRKIEGRRRKGVKEDEMVG